MIYHLKLIKEIYPNAKLILCKRDVLSSIMSIFQNNLTELAWTHDLENIFKYFKNIKEKSFPNNEPHMINLSKKMKIISVSILLTISGIFQQNILSKR